MMHEREKSDPAVVAVKPVNNAERSAAEPVEPRAGAEGNADQHSTCRAQNRVSVSQALERMRQSRTYGSVRGALSNERPYRDPTSADALRAAADRSLGELRRTSGGARH